jgi:hypothetical protein
LAVVKNRSAPKKELAQDFTRTQTLRKIIFPSKRLDGLEKAMLSEKKGVLIFYKHLHILEEAGLSYEEKGKIFCAAIKYDETGEVPTFESNTLTAFFSMIKYDIDANREKWEAIKLERSEAGKKGGRPRKKNPEANGSDENKITNRFTEEQGADLTISLITEEAKNHGFFLDQNTVQQFCNCGINNEWFCAPYSFIEFAAGRIEKHYYGRSKSEQKSLFISAVKTWDDLRQEFPSWREGKIRSDIEKEQQEKEKAARSNHPETCTCGGTLRRYSNNFFCETCKAEYSFNAEVMEWEQHKVEENDFLGLLGRWKKKIGG